ncbi:MAG: response regulator [Myxococcales bacterium]|nr:response regulator [Myxococcales bacterium]
MRILVVEDDEGIRDGLAEFLSDLAAVRAVGGAREAREAMLEEAFDVIFTDLRIGGEMEAGREVIDAARRLGAAVVLMSGASGREIDGALGCARADAILTKPFDLDEVERVLAGCVGRRAG